MKAADPFRLSHDFYNIVNLLLFAGYVNALYITGRMGFMDVNSTTITGRLKQDRLRHCRYPERHPPPEHHLQADLHRINQLIMVDPKLQ